MSKNPLADVGPDEVEADFIILSHAHFDHFGDTEKIARRTGATVIAMNELAKYLDERGLVTEALQIGGGQDFPFGRVKFVQAYHSSSLDGRYMGSEAGIVVTDHEGVVLYHAGDTGLYSDMAMLEPLAVDLALLPIGDKYTMGPEDAARAVELIRPRTAVPIHYDTFSSIRQDPHSWKDMVESRTDTLVLVLKPGDSCEVYR